MKALRNLHLDLQACVLEDRLLPVIANLGVIVLTPSGYVLTTPMPVFTAYFGGTAGGTPIPTSFSMTGFGISSVQPGNSTGNPSLATAGTTATGGGGGQTISVGSGANDASAPNIPVVTRNTIANDALNPAPSIGRASGDQSPVLPTGQSYRGGVPVTPPVQPEPESPGESSSYSPSQGPVDSSPIRLAGALPRRPSDVSGHSMKTLASGMS